MQGRLGHTFVQLTDPAGDDFPAAHCTGSQASQDITLHPGQDDVQLL
jgi:hypothetical protein